MIVPTFVLAVLSQRQELSQPPLFAFVSVLNVLDASDVRHVDKKSVRADVFSQHNGPVENAKTGTNTNRYKTQACLL